MRRLLVFKVERGRISVPCRSLRSLEKRPRRNIKSYCDSLNVVDRHVLFAAFDHAHICPVDAGSLGQLFLREPAFLPQSPDISGENGDQSSFVDCTSHPLMVSI